MNTMGTVRKASVVCSNCDTDLVEQPADEVREPCPKCGSPKRRFNRHIVDSVSIHEMLAMKMRRRGKRGDPAIESKNGDSFSTRLGRWMKLEQVIDRENNRYRKKVWDPKTGQILREADKPLTEHRGHGSAEDKKP